MAARSTVLIVMVLMLGMCEGIQRGPGDRSVRMKNLKTSNTDLKAVREKYKDRTRNDDACRFDPSPSDPPLPTVPDSFMTQVELMIEKDDLQKVIHGVEMYDSIVKRGVNDYDLSVGVILTRPELKREEIHYNIDLDEALFIHTNDPCSVTGEEDCDLIRRCTAGNIKDMSAMMQEIFGFVDTGNGGEFMGAMGLMQFGPYFNYTYTGMEYCRGARCNVFEACVTKPDEGNITLTYAYYWTTDDWDVQNNGNSVPMILDIVDPRPGGMTLHIDFFDFRRDWRPSLDELEVPAEVYCQDRRTYISQPKTLANFFYKSELVTGVDALLPVGEVAHLRLMYPQQEWYDYNARISRTDFVPFFVFGADRRFENYTQQVLEFNQGLMYKVHPRLSSCKISPINYNFTWGDVVVGDDGSIHMMSPWNWEDLAEPMQYNGLHWERGMSADVWVGIKQDPTFKINETIVWYFASPFTDQILGRDNPRIPIIPTADKVPIKLEKYMTKAQTLPHLVYHIYAFEGTIPLTHNHDVSLCFQKHQMRHFTIDLPKNALEKSLFLRENLKYAIQGALAEAGHVSPLRINRIELKQMKEALRVTFTILEKPSLVADVDESGAESSMNDATSSIRTTLDHSQLIIMVKYGNKPDDTTKNTLITILTASPHTMKEVTRNGGQPEGKEVVTGYSSGDMAGLAVGMIILGLITGYGGVYVYGSRK